MKKFTDLLLFEINRIKKAYLMLIGLIVSLQIVANIWASNNFMRIYKNYLKETRGSMNDFLVSKEIGIIGRFRNRLVILNNRLETIKLNKARLAMNFFSLIKNKNRRGCHHLKRSCYFGHFKSIERQHG